MIGTAGDPFVAAERIGEQMPDVITLDIEMPRMDGLTFLQKIMSQHPIPVVICSSLAEEGAQSTLQGAGVWRGRHHRQAAVGHQAVSGGIARHAVRGGEGRGGSPRRSSTAAPAPSNPS